MHVHNDIQNKLNENTTIELNIKELATLAMLCLILGIIIG